MKKELIKLLKEVQHLKMENDVLKQAALILASHPVIVDDIPLVD
ncbi:TPA: hypothetical protein ACU1UG_001578 [Staphylococcus aureus]